MTGPAIVNIFTPIPNTCPSFLYSIAGATTLFAKPVIGTKLPAPPQFASDGYQFKLVSTMLHNTSIMEHQAAASCLSNPKLYFAILVMICPIRQIPPPSTNAFAIFTPILCVELPVLHTHYMPDFFPPLCFPDL